MKTLRILHRQFALLYFVIFIMLFSCQQKKSNEVNTVPTKKPLIVTTITPYKFLLQELAGDDIEVLNISEQSADPHIVNITPQQVVQLKKADLFLSLSPIEERVILKSLGEQTKVVEMWQGIPQLHYGTGHTHDEDDHDEDEHDEDERDEDEHDEDERDEQNWDVHFWLNPSILPIQIETMARELKILLPEQKVLLQSNAEKLLQRCDQISKYLQQKLPLLQNGMLMTFHGALSYFADFFDAKQLAIETGGVELGSKEILQLFSENAANLTFPALIIAPQFEQEKAKILAKQLKLQVVIFDPQYPDIFVSLSRLADELIKTTEKNF